MNRRLPERVIILGGGASMREGKWDKPISEMPLWTKLSTECTFGINSIFEFFTPTVLTFVDYYFHSTNKVKLDNLPLIIGKTHPNPNKCPKGDNLVLLPVSNKYYGKQSLTQILNPKKPKNKRLEKAGIYTSQLTGLFTLTLCIMLGFKEIYLLGFDFGEVDGKTHFYQEDNPENQIIGINKYGKKTISGLGKDKNGNYKTSCYGSNPNNWFDVYKPELKNINIYTVGLESKINTFPKISYTEFYNDLENQPIRISQSLLQHDIKDFIEKRMEQI